MRGSSIAALLVAVGSSLPTKAMVFTEPEESSRAGYDSRIAGMMNDAYIMTVPSTQSIGSSTSRSSRTGGSPSTYIQESATEPRRIPEELPPASHNTRAFRIPDLNLVPDDKVAESVVLPDQFLAQQESDPESSLVASYNRRVLGAGSVRGSIGQNPANVQVFSEPQSILTFSVQPYPLDIPAFQHLYTSSELMSPLNIETFLNSRGNLRSFHTIFRPEPVLLAALHKKLWDSLSELGHRPAQVFAARQKVVQGAFLWPPVTPAKRTQDGLDIARIHLSQPIRRFLSNHFEAHKLEGPRIFRIEVPIYGQARQVLMIKSRGSNFLPGKISPRSSALYFFFEGWRYPAQTRMPQLAFLGAAFLPKEGVEELKSAGVIRPAFQDLARLPHA